MTGTKQQMGKLLEWWWSRQGLDGRLAGADPAAVLEKTGWTRSLGGVGPYLALFARAGLSREAVDAAVAHLEIHELPAARNCTYVLPASDFALGLRAGQAFAGGEEKVAAKLGVKEAELAKLREGVLKALKKEALDPDQLRESLGSLVRSLGEEGKKKGLTTTLPAALGRLQAEGEIRRIPANGRLDHQRYRYTLWNPNPLRGFRATQEETSVELARRYFRWIGPASMKDFQAFSGLGVKSAAAAIEPLKLVPFPDGGELLMFPADREAFENFRASKEPQYAFLASVDGIGLFRRDVAGLGGEEAKSAPQGLKDWASHPILDRGHWIGSWEYDPEAEAVVWAVWVKKDKALEAAAKRTGEFVRRELGDARAFSLDSPKSRAPRIAALKKGY